MHSALALIVADGFDTNRNYLAEGTRGTIWDGILNSSNAVMLEASTDNGQLTIGISTNSGALDWSAASTNAPFIFRKVSGDFDVRVKVAGPFPADSGSDQLVVRLCNPGADGNAGEDFLLVEIHHDPSESLIRNRSVDDGDVTDSEPVTTSDSYLRITRSNTVFKAYYSADGNDWTPINWGGDEEEALDRNDLSGLVQVGLSHSGGEPIDSEARFDDFQVDALPTLRIGIAEHQDAYTGVLGLNDFLNGEGYSVTNFSSSFQNGVVPNLTNIDLMIVGSFLTQSTQKRNTYMASSNSFRSFVAQGGTLIVLCQADQNVAVESWMEPNRMLIRADPDYKTAYAIQRSHLLLNKPCLVTSNDLTGWLVPSTWPGYNTAWEAFTDYDTAGVVLGTDALGTSQCLLEYGWGTGRALFYAMALDKASVTGNVPAKTASRKLLRNALAYAQQVKNGLAPPMQISLGDGFAYPVHGHVFMDYNTNGIMDEGEARAGVRVSGALQVVPTDSSGYYVLTNSAHWAKIVFVCQPSDAVKTSEKFYYLLSSNMPDRDFDFPLRPLDASYSTNSTFFVNIGDIHTDTTANRDQQNAAMNELRSLYPSPDFVVVSGDSVENGTAVQFDRYQQAEGTNPFAVFNVLGNHDQVNSGDIEFRKRCGPDYYSFDHGGAHFIVRNVVTPSGHQDIWLQNDLAAFGAGKPVVLFQHYAPTKNDLAQFDSWNIHSVFSAHWHSDKYVESTKTISRNIPPFVMGGVDCSPRGFGLAHINSSGALTREWRYGGVRRALTVVHPAVHTAVNQHLFPIIVNAYDSSVQVSRVTWSLSQNGESLASGELNPNSQLNWTGDFSGALDTNFDAILKVTVEDALGRSWPAKEITNSVVNTMPTNPVPDSTWPMFMGQATHAGAVSSYALHVPLRMSWSVDTGGDLDFSSPILADGRIYMALKRRSCNRDNGIAAFDPADGQLIWKANTAFAINHSPAYDSGVICASEVGGRVYGFDAVSGNPRWTCSLADNLGRYSYCAPAVDGGRFYVGTMCRLARINATNGVKDWETSLNNSDWISSYCSPAVGGNYLVMGGKWNNNPNQNVAVLDKNTTNKIWSGAVDLGLTGSPLISGNRLLVVGESSTLFCCSLTNGALLWQRSLGSGWAATTPAVNDGVVVAGSGNGLMKGINLDNGTVMWTHKSGKSIFEVSPYGRDNNALLSSPTIVLDKVFFGSADGHLYCLDLYSGYQLWSYDFGVPVLSTPLVSGNALFVGTYDGRLYAFTTDSDYFVPSEDDVDNDTLPDSWELQYFPSLTNMNRRTDNDEDGRTDLQEFHERTNPRNAASPLWLKQTDMNPNFAYQRILRWPSEENKIYSIERSTNLMEGFQPVEHGTNLPATPPSNTFTNEDSSPVSYYRIKIESP